MNVETLSFHAKSGWSRWPPPSLDSDRTLVLVFGAPRFGAQDGPLRELRAAFPRAYFLGCSTSGEIHGPQVADDSLSVAVARFERTWLRAAAAPVADRSQSFAAGKKLARELAHPELRHVLVLSDGLSVNGSALVRGLNAGLPDGVQVTGGLAGDGTAFKSTWVLKNGSPVGQWVSAMGLYGDGAQVRFESKGGWDIFGPEREVTRSDQNVLYALDGKPALELYKRYLGERAAELPAAAFLFPLAIRSDAGSSPLVRTILGLDERTQSLTFAGDIPESSRARLMHANMERLVQAGSEAAAGLVRGEEQPALTLAFSCVGRRLVLGERTEEEVEAVLPHLPTGAAMVGFYSYGELAPNGDRRCELHNQTLSLTAIGER